MLAKMPQSALGHIVLFTTDDSDKYRGRDELHEVNTASGFEGGYFMSKRPDEERREERKMKRLEEAQKTIREVKKNYSRVENSIIHQLKLQTPSHHLTTGAYRESVWQSLFEQIIPRKFCIDQGIFIIDSYGNISAEVDLAIFDEQYTPYIFRYGSIKFIPIEAVAVVVQCKSKHLDYENLADWVDSITDLKTNYNSMARMYQGIVINNLKHEYEHEMKRQAQLDAKASGNNDVDDTSTQKEKCDEKKQLSRDERKTQTATRPLRILCTTHSSKPSEKITSLFDFVLYEEGDTLQVFSNHEEKRNYVEWFDQLNHFDHDRYDSGEEAEKYKTIKRETSIGRADKSENIGQTIASLRVTDSSMLTLTFQLNQLLMLINNPMLFPHSAYVEMFNKPTTEEDSIGKVKEDTE
jgi:hypothetical protein